MILGILIGLAIAVSIPLGIALVDTIRNEWEWYVRSKYNYYKTIDKACEWLSKQGKDWWEGYGIPFSLEDFKKAMEEE